MKLLKVKTGRFSQVIETCGKPQVYTLWQKPSADRHFQSQIKNASFKEGKDARYLVFPKSLKRFADKRIIGIDWSLVRQ